MINPFRISSSPNRLCAAIENVKSPSEKHVKKMHFLRFFAPCEIINKDIRNSRRALTTLSHDMCVGKKRRRSDK